MPHTAAAIALRNRLAHGYDTTDDAVVFSTVTVDFPVFVAALDRELQAWE